MIEQGDKRAYELANLVDKIFWHCQPIVRMGTQEVVMHELLARIQNSTGGTVSAWAVIEEINRLATEHKEEDNPYDKLLRLLDRKAIRFAVKRLKANKALGIHISYAVNLSGTTISDPHFVGYVIDQLQELAIAGVNPSQLCFEMTEHKPYSAAGVLSLRNIGVAVGADDYGEGFNSLCTFEDNDFDFIKIGGRFSKGLLNGSIKNRAAIMGVMAMARELGIPVVFESVEIEPIARLIYRVWSSSPVFQCELWGQGWHYGRDSSCL